LEVIIFVFFKLNSHLFQFSSDSGYERQLKTYYYGTTKRTLSALEISWAPRSAYLLITHSLTWKLFLKLLFIMIIRYILGQIVWQCVWIGPLVNKKRQLSWQRDMSV